MHAHEPLRRGAENQRCLVPPAVRIGVLIVLVVQQRARSASAATMLALALKTCCPAKCGVSSLNTPLPATGLSTGRIVALADRIVLLAVGRRRVHGAGACIDGDVLAENDRHLALEQRMLQQLVLQRAALAAAAQHVGAPRP
jgi:hypothetical protein